MTLFELIDRIDQRRSERLAARPKRPFDINAFVGVLFLAGYYAMVWQFSKRALPTENLDLIRDAMLTLGPPVGIIVGALFRADRRDEQATENTGEAFRAITATAKASNPEIEPDVTLQPGETAQAAPKTET